MFLEQVRVLLQVLVQELRLLLQKELVVHLLEPRAGGSWLLQRRLSVRLAGG